MQIFEYMHLQKWKMTYLTPGYIFCLEAILHNLVLPASIHSLVIYSSSFWLVLVLRECELSIWATKEKQGRE